MRCVFKNRMIECHEGITVKNKVYLLARDKLTGQVLYINWGHRLLDFEPKPSSFLFFLISMRLNNLALTEMIRALFLHSSLHELK